MRSALALLLLLEILVAGGHGGVADDEVRVHFRRELGRLDKFWASTGFAPPSQADASDFLLSVDVAKNLALIGSLPRGSVRQVRVHWLLELVGMDSDRLEPDFSELDRFVHRLWTSDLKPGFEVMGNPGGYFDDFEDPVQLLLWREMVRDLAERYLAKYGSEEVAGWNFESWNEPDHRDFGNLNMSVSSFLNYYDATSEGLLSADPRLRFGGPGGSCREPHMVAFCHALLRHADSGVNYFTGGDVRLNFVSVHKKGEADWEAILEEESRFHDFYAVEYPHLAGTPFFNDEGDPEKSWWRDREWRGSSAYPAMVGALVAATVGAREEGRLANLELLSSDNAFLNDVSEDDDGHFDQRTLTARFACDDDTSTFVQKPVFNGFALLGLLGGEKRVQVEVTPSSSVAALAAEVDDAGTAANVLLVNGGDQGRRVRVKLNGVPRPVNTTLEAKYVWYTLSDSDTDPRGEWFRMGRPKCPTREQAGRLRRAAELKRKEVKKLDRTHLITAMPANSMKLLQLCLPDDRHSDVPDQPGGIRFFREAHGGALVTWRYPGKVHCLEGFSLEHSSDLRNFAAVNAGREGVLTFFQVEEATEGWWYRVRATDVWGRPGPYSAPVILQYQN